MIVSLTVCEILLYNILYTYFIIILCNVLKKQDFGLLLFLLLWDMTSTIKKQKLQKYARITNTRFYSYIIILLIKLSSTSFSFFFFFYHTQWFIIEFKFNKSITMTYSITRYTRKILYSYHFPSFFFIPRFVIYYTFCVSFIITICIKYV